MIQVKYISERSEDKFEEELNRQLEELQLSDFGIVDIKFNTVTPFDRDSNYYQDALIIYNTNREGAKL